MSDVRVGTLERLLQIAVTLGRATEDVTKLQGNMTVILASYSNYGELSKLYGNNSINDQYNS